MPRDGTATILLPWRADYIVEGRFGRNLDTISNPSWIPPFHGGFFSEDRLSRRIRSMSSNSQLTSIRDAVISAAAEFGLLEPAPTKTVVLTRDGYFVGRRFLLDGLQAVWLIDENVIRFFTDDGDLLKTIEGGKEPCMKKAA